MSSSSQKAPSQNHPPGHDPHLTPWPEEQQAASKPLSQKKNVRDWLVIFAAVMLGLYVISFLVIGTADSGSFGGFTSGGRIAIIPIYGEITTSTDSGSVGYLDVIASLEQAEADSSIDAILLDIDSPGGSVVSTKQIVAFIQTDINKPIVSWIGEVGASGGYYLAAATDYILADSDSITGSIGVISEQYNVQGLFEKLGIEVVDINAGKFKTIGSPFREMTEEEKEILQELVDQANGHFKQDIIKFRRDKGLNEEKFSAVSDGRILTGQQAFDVGLIDATGTRQQAILKASQLAGFDGTPEVETIEQEHFSLSDLFFSAGKNFGMGFSSGIQSQKNQTNIIEAK